MSRELSSDERKCPNLKCEAPYAATANYCYDCGEALSEGAREKQKKQREQERELNAAITKINKLEEKNQGLEEKIDALRKKNGILEERIGDLRKTNRDLERKIGDLEKQDRDLEKSNKAHDPKHNEEQNNIPKWYYWSFLGLAVGFLIFLIFLIFLYEG
ncbi:MAG: hypothetical protein LBD59_09515 [Prevotellaceae bacterium]|jgi:septal ring factor EnvC (AmiA/AmiB activator)|nr:hypothetical protein [Prevotellaceae bacterium]